MNRVFALVVVMLTGINVYAASPTPTSPICGFPYSSKFWQALDKINLDNESYESQEEIIRTTLARFHYVYEEMEENKRAVLVAAARDGLAQKWWAANSRTQRAITCKNS